MTPKQKIRHAIINRVAHWNNETPPYTNIDNVDALYELLADVGRHRGAKKMIRVGEMETGIPCESSITGYEGRSVAMQVPDGTWVGWTCWRGKGKHSHPEIIDWMGEAYDVECKKERKVVVVRKFKKAG